MADASGLPNIDLAGVWALANRALDRANEVAVKQAVTDSKTNEVAVKQAVTDSKLDQHLIRCIEMREEDRRTQSNDRLEVQKWREGLGKRLDLFSRYGIAGLIAVIGILLSIVGFLITHGAVKFGG